MIFSSWQFILLFLPISFLVYFWLNYKRLIIFGKVWLVLVSLFFYAYWNIHYLPLILGSILFNYVIGNWLSRSYTKSPVKQESHHKFNRTIILIIGIVANLLLLGYYKYTGFLFSNANYIFGTSFPESFIILPLAISFFTFTQIVYLVDSYSGETAEYNLLHYSLFVTFFPHLIAGPIVNHRQIMPQFASNWTLFIRYQNILKGLFIFSIGLFKKIVIADNFAIWAKAGFDGGQTLGFFEAWATSLSYTFQLYFDFSGYCDMAIGASLLFNIWLPINFNSPYKALDIQDFWRRWHITLSNFLRDYLYIPLGGNHYGAFRTYFNIFVTFLLGGFWHGSTWMFVIWGAIHGLALVFHRAWQNFRRPLPPVLAWVLTFMFINCTWVIFRANNIHDAKRVLFGMFNFHSILGDGSSPFATADLAWGGWMSDFLLNFLPVTFIGQAPIYLVIFAAFIIISQKNSMDMISRPISSWRLAYGITIFSISIYFMLAATTTVFLYFTF